MKNKKRTVTIAGGDISTNVEKRSFFTEYNTKLFKNLLETEEDYSYHMKTLWILRDLLDKKIQNEGGSIADNPVFPLLDTINEIIGCLLTGHIHFDFKGNAYEIIDNKIKYLSCKK